MDTTGWRVNPADDSGITDATMDELLPGHALPRPRLFSRGARLRFRWGRDDIPQLGRPLGGGVHLDVTDAADARLDALDVAAGQLLGDLDLHPEHQLFPLALRL